MRKVVSIELVLVLALAVCSSTNAQVSNTATQPITFAVHRSAPTVQNITAIEKSEAYAVRTTDSKLFQLPLKQVTAKVTIFTSKPLVTEKKESGTAAYATMEQANTSHKDVRSLPNTNIIVARGVDRCIITVTE